VWGKMRGRKEVRVDPCTNMESPLTNSRKKAKSRVLTILSVLGTDDDGNACAYVSPWAEGGLVRQEEDLPLPKGHFSAQEFLEPSQNFMPARALLLVRPCDPA
jgi:hypothetical protein